MVGIRGTLGGITFSANKSGPYCKAWSKSTSIPTPKQNAQRTVFSQMPGEWRDLTQVQRDGWATWAALPAQDLTNSLSETYSISGYSWFVKINTWRNTVGRGIRTVAPTIAKPGAPTTTTLVVTDTAEAGDAKITYPAATYAGFDQFISSSLQQSTANQHPSNTFRTLFVDLTPGNLQAEFRAEIDALYGIIQEDQRVAVRAYRQTTEGYRSDPTETQANVS